MADGKGNTKKGAAAHAEMALWQHFPAMAALVADAHRIMGALVDAETRAAGLAQENATLRQEITALREYADARRKEYGSRVKRAAEDAAKAAALLAKTGAPPPVLSGHPQTFQGRKEV